MMKDLHFTLADFNTSERLGGGRYEHILCKILDRLENIKGKAGNVSMTINSGYRNPYRQARVSKAKEGLHMYGLAADIVLDDFNGDGKTNKKDWIFMADSAKKEGACVEPMDEAPTWIHMDWRGDCPSDW